VSLTIIASIHAPDIKPANILLDEEGNAKLGDLNVSKWVDDGGEVQVSA
jgi:serine/threonine protein kinase